MNQKQIAFIRKKLIPFILREHGRGFAMNVWIEKEKPNQKVLFDRVIREMPLCGTIACIGGSIEFLMRGKDRYWEFEKIIGLSELQINGLFYCWQIYTDHAAYPIYRWPHRFALRFHKATTPLTKAKVACALLERAIKTNGNCLDSSHPSSK